VSNAALMKRAERLIALGGSASLTDADPAPLREQANPPNASPGARSAAVPCELAAYSSALDSATRAMICPNLGHLPVVRAGISADASA
jgi:hypothetical protein